MRLFILMLSAIGFAISGSASAQAQSGEAGDEVVGASPIMVGNIRQQNVDNMRHRICAAMNEGRNTDGYSIPTAITSTIATYAGIDPAEESARLRMAAAFNRYGSQMICSPTSGLYPTQHIFKRAIELGVQRDTLLEFFFADPEGFPIDPNLIEVARNGTMTTVLDYIDAVLALPDARDRYNVGEIIRLRRILQTRFGAKTVAEMSPEEIEFQMAKPQVVRD